MKTDSVQVLTRSVSNTYGFCGPNINSPIVSLIDVRKNAYSELFISFMPGGHVCVCITKKTSSKTKVIFVKCLSTLDGTGGHPR